MKWAVALTMCLASEALTVAGRMTTEDSLNYKNVKLALLQCFLFTAQGDNEKFRQAQAKGGKTGFNSFHGSQDTSIGGWRWPKYQKRTKSYEIK